MLAAVICVGILTGAAQLPAPESLIVPLWADTTVEVEVSLYAPESAPLPVWFQVSWGDGETLDWTGPANDYLDILQYHRYRAPGTFDLTARVKNEAGAMSDWCPARRITVGEQIQKWSFVPGEDPVVCAPSLDLHGNVYFGDESGTLYSLTPGGTLRWTARTRDAIYGAPVIVGNHVYYGSLDSTLYCVDTAGKPVWNLGLGDALYSPPAIAGDGTIYIGTDLGSLVSVTNKGKLRWSRKLGDEIAAPATIGANGLIYQTADSVYCFDAKGRRRWAFGAPEGDYFFAAAVPDLQGLVYAGNNDGSLYCVGPDGRLRWRAPAPDEDEVRPEITVGLDGSLYFGSDGYYLIRKRPGAAPETMFETNDIIIASAAISDKGTCYFLSDDGTLRAFAADGRLLYSREVVAGAKEVYYTGSPTIAPDGTVYVTSWDGGVFAFRGDGPPANTWWPQYRHDAQHTGRVQPPRRR
jgi:outer membrane protein assembly factor BamB